MTDYSLVEYFGENVSRCGYCKNTECSKSNGMWTHSLTVQDYQDLIDRGWRRSGKYCYKPILHETCCVLYTIKCAALDLQLSKSQKKIIKNVNKYLLNGIKEKNLDNDESQSFTCGDQVNLDKRPNLQLPDNLGKIENSCETMDSIGSASSDTTLDSSGEPHMGHIHYTSQTGEGTLKSVRKGIGADLSKPPCKKAKLLRLERRNAKLSSKGLPVDTKQKNKVIDKTIEDLINDVPENTLHKLELRLTPSSEVLKLSKEAFYVYRKYQIMIHHDPPEKCNEDQFIRFLIHSPLQCHLVSTKSAKFLETLNVSHKIYTKYQMVIHKDTESECDMQSYKEFLCDSPLQTCGDYGSYHQQYYLDGKLIAVGVIDILPNCVSSVYFYYDPDFGHLSLGTYGALRELMLTRSLNQIYPDLKYYYMGYYINNCPKMRYKAKLRPSFLLCPVAYTWHSIEKCLPRIETTPYLKLSDEGKTDANNCTQDDLDKIRILYETTVVPYQIYKRRKRIDSDAKEIEEYASLVGKSASRRILLYRQ